MASFYFPSILSPSPRIVLSCPLAVEMPHGFPSCMVSLLPQLIRRLLSGLYMMRVNSILRWTYNSENMNSGLTSKLTKRPQAREQMIQNMWALCQDDRRGRFLVMKPRQVPEIFEHSHFLLCKVWAIIIPTS